jgi:acetyltransferase
MVVIFGTPGLAPVFDVYEVLREKMQQCSKPIYPVLPSVTTAAEEVKEFLSHGAINFPDEVQLGEALTRIHATGSPFQPEPPPPGIDLKAIGQLLDEAAEGYLKPELIQELLNAAGIPRVSEGVAKDEDSLFALAHSAGFPLVMKVVGPLHKSDVGGVALGIRNDVELMEHFEAMGRIEGYQGVLIQPMLDGMEVFAGATYEPGFGHLVLCGIGGIYVEVMRDTASGLAPLSLAEARHMITSLRGYEMLKGTRGQQGIHLDLFAEILVRLSVLLDHHPEIRELDLNPIMGREDKLAVVDARIKVIKS